MAWQLALDTSTPYAGVALFRDGVLQGETLLRSGASHARLLLPLLEQLQGNMMAGYQTPEAVAVVRGPGSFTGLRVGLATAAGLAAGWQASLWGVDALAALAWQASAQRQLPVAALLDARKQQVYAAVYQWQNGQFVCLVPPRAMDPGQLAAQLPQGTLLVGSGAVAFADYWQQQSHLQLACGPANQLRAATIGALAFDPGAAAGHELAVCPHIEPMYLRPAEAQLAWRQKAAGGSQA